MWNFYFHYKINKVPYFFLKVVKIFAIQGIVISKFSILKQILKILEFFKMFFVKKFEIAFLSEFEAKFHIFSLKIFKIFAIQGIALSNFIKSLISKSKYTEQVHEYMSVHTTHKLHLNLHLHMSLIGLIVKHLLVILRSYWLNSIFTNTILCKTVK